jgi:hypothetical protein
VLGLALGLGRDEFTIESTHTEQRSLTPVPAMTWSESSPTGLPSSEVGMDQDEVVVSSANNRLNEIGALLTVLGDESGDLLTIDDTGNSSGNFRCADPDHLDRTPDAECD